MKKHLFESIRVGTLSAGAITLLISAGVAGCSANADPSFTPSSPASASNETTTVIPLQPWSREWIDANFGDTGL